MIKSLESWGEIDVYHGDDLYRLQKNKSIPLYGYYTFKVGMAFTSNVFVCNTSSGWYLDVGSYVPLEASQCYVGLLKLENLQYEAVGIARFTLERPWRKLAW
jgi:hypothetical protein